jgi:hypothetical protein
MHRPLLIVGGIFNVALALFHVWLGRQIHRLADVNPGHKALMEMLNAGGTLMIIFFAVASLAFAADLLGTRLGRLVLWLVFAVYFSRAIEEVLSRSAFHP